MTSHQERMVCAKAVRQARSSNKASITEVRSVKGRILSGRIASQLGVFEEVTQPFWALVASSWFHKLDFNCPWT